MSEEPEETLTATRPASFDPTPFAARFCTDGNNVVVASGEIDIYTAPKLWEALAVLIERGYRDVVLDMAAVTFVDSQGVAAIVRAHKQLATDGGTVVVRAPQAQARQVFEITGLTQVIQLEE